MQIILTEITPLIKSNSLPKKSAWLPVGKKELMVSGGMRYWMGKLKRCTKRAWKNQALANKTVSIGLVTYKKNDNGTYDLSMMEKGAKNTNQFATYSNLSTELISIIDTKKYQIRFWMVKA